MNQLTGKRALVTGGSRGIGAAIAQALANNGADVVITYQSSPERALGVVAAIEQTGRRGVAIQADSADPEAIKRAVQATVETLGGLDILVNSAAIAIYGPVAQTDIGQFQKLMDINVRGPFVAAQAAIPHLPAGGRIISIGSTLGERVPFPGVTAYSMSKSALSSFTRGLSRELGPQGITVNLVQPGSTDTEANPADGEGAEHQRGLTSVGRFAKPKEIADMVVYLASPLADMVNGATLTIDGGRMPDRRSDGRKMKAFDRIFIDGLAGMLGFSFGVSTTPFPAAIPTGLSDKTLLTLGFSFLSK